MNSVDINHYVEGILTASLGTSLILFGLPSLATIPKVTKGTTKKQSFKILFAYCQFFLSCFLLGYDSRLVPKLRHDLTSSFLNVVFSNNRACITIRVLAYQFNPDFGLFYLAAALPAGAAVALFGLLFYRLLMLVYGVYVGMLIGMVIEAGVSNATDMNDEHQCTASPPSSSLCVVLFVRFRSSVCLKFHFCVDIEKARKKWQGKSYYSPILFYFLWPTGGKLITLTAGILIGFLTLKSSTTSWLPRLIYAVAGSALLAMSPPCWGFLPDDVRRPPPTGPQSEVVQLS
jgi:hypothetical protein